MMMFNGFSSPLPGSLILSDIDNYGFLLMGTLLGFLLLTSFAFELGERPLVNLGERSR